MPTASEVEKDENASDNGSGNDGGDSEDEEFLGLMLGRGSAREDKGGDVGRERSESGMRGRWGSGRESREEGGIGRSIRGRRERIFGSGRGRRRRRFRWRDRI